MKKYLGIFFGVYLVFFILANAYNITNNFGCGYAPHSVGCRTDPIVSVLFATPLVIGLIIAAVLIYKEFKTSFKEHVFRNIILLLSLIGFVLVIIWINSQGGHWGR